MQFTDKIYLIAVSGNADLKVKLVFRVKRFTIFAYVLECFFFLFWLSIHTKYIKLTYFYLRIVHINVMNMFFNKCAENKMLHPVFFFGSL